MRFLACPILGLVLSFVPAATLRAQTCVYGPDKNATTGGLNAFPFTSNSNFKYQILVPASLAGTRTGIVRELSFAPSTNGMRRFGSIKIRMENTKLTKLSRTFASNISAQATTVLDAQNFVWHLRANSWTRIGLQTNFVRIPAQGAGVIIEIELRSPRTVGGSVGSFHSGSGVSRVWANGWTTTPPTSGRIDTGTRGGALKVELCFDLADASHYGLACQGSNGRAPLLTVVGTPQLTKAFNVSLTNAPAVGTAIALIIGLSNAKPLPADLGPAGAPGCSLYQTLDFTVPAAAVGGKANLPVTLASSSSLVGLRLYGQFLLVDPPANGLDLTFSNYARVLIGR